MWSVSQPVDLDLDEGAGRRLGALRDFEMNLLRRFTLRGVALDLMIALVLGAAFGAVVTALVKDVVGPWNCP